MSRSRFFEIVSTGQREHGMKHRDYARYRAYCARRLARLYKTCKMKHGKGRFVQQPLVANAITDERTLLVPLTQSERAWAYAMEMKDLTNVKKRKSDLKQHVLRRLRKAASYATELAQFVHSWGANRPRWKETRMPTTSEARMRSNRGKITLLLLQNFHVRSACTRN